MSELRKTMRERRTYKQISAIPIERELVESLVETASFAPFHSKVEPWQVRIIETDEQKERYIEATLSASHKTDEAELAKVREKVMQKITAAPVVLIVSTMLFGNEKKDFESLAATSAFIQNLQLIAWENEIGMVWRTPGWMFDSVFSEALGLPEDERLIGILPLSKRGMGVPDAKPRRKLEDYLHDL
ncbi:nitroreductase [Listeria floridensis FSL S10-1187]|uniref:Nitroreductase n=1 Tax=Listeria floridensis FSL S10-1187 TaxID=1265817 RepID=A0ABN0RC30_9LIST|nr:nitroreductase [Listeria floridensis]EUJ26364.1 nitroreductase [Listeria floridensis FSL S10-1187]